MKIGISATPVYTIDKKLKNIDGIGTYTANLCQALAAQNVQIKEIYFKKPNEIFLKPSPEKKNFYVANTPLLSLLPGNYYNHLKNQIDLLHITDYLVPRVRNVPVIATIHDAIMLKHAQSCNIRHLKGYLLKKLAKQADHVITCSYAIVDDLVNFWHIPRNNISVTPYGLSPVWNQPINPAIRKEILKKYQLTKPFFLTVGTLQPRKNIERMINAYIALPTHIRENFNLVLVGKNHPSLTAPALIEKINTLEKTGQVRWLQYINFDDLRSIYQSAHLLLFPSLAEGFGFPILEGFASAIPVITSHFGSTAEIAGDAAFLVDPYSEDAISKAMLDLVEKADLRDQLIKRGLSQVANYTWEKCAEQTIAVYKKFI